MKNLLLFVSLLVLPGLSFGVSDILDNWIPANSGTTADLKGIAYGNGLFVAIGNTNHAIISADGTNWQKHATGVTAVNDIAFGADQFVAVGFPGIVVTSSNGMVWTQQSIETNRNFLCVTYGNGQFIVGGSSGDIFASPDGLAWTRRTSDLTNSPLPFLDGPVRDIACLNGRFIATGLSAGNVVSSNGVIWILNENNPSGLTYFGVASDGFPTWAKVGANGSVYYSFDGLNWNTSLPYVTQNTLRRVNVGGSVYVAVGDGGTIVTSQYYPAPRSIVSGTTQNLNDVICGDGRFVIVGNGGTILTVQTRPRITDFRQLADGTAQMKSKGVYNQVYILKASTNLINWEGVSVSGPDANGEFILLDGYFAPNFNQVFYRVDTEF